MEKQIPPKGLLFHYTSSAGLRGIINSDTIRATHIRYLNDSDEFVNALNYLEGLVREFHPAIQHSVELFLEATIGLFKNEGIYVASFTDDAAALHGTDQLPGDRLNQWRAYCTAGQGFSLGFDYDAFDPEGAGMPMGEPGFLAFLHNCIYDQETKQRVFGGAGQLMADECLQSSLDFAEWAMNRVVDSAAEMARIGALPLLDVLALCPAELRERILCERRNLMLGLVLNATSFKHEAFFEEKEWRIIIFGPRRNSSTDDVSDASFPRVQFRSGPFGITPFIEFPLHLRTPGSPLRRIVVGPMPYMDEAVHATTIMLEGSGILVRSKNCPNGIEIVPSRIPFRHW